MATNAGTIYSEIRLALDKLTGDIQQVNAKLDAFAKKNKTKSEEVKKTWSDSFKKINVAGVLAFAAIAMAVTSAIKTFAQYQQSMANVRSVTSASATDFKKLEDAAIAAGESTRFTASQAAEALYFLASAGLSATQSINALQGVLQLAGATQSDLASTSATMVATLAQFSLAETESTRVSNVFAAAISGSQATMDKLAVSMKKVGPISGAFNVSLEETTANLEALYNAGFTGEEAGTALRNIMLGLTQESGPIIEKLKALGIAFEDVNPQEVGLTSAIDTLTKSGIDLAQVFERRTVAAILQLSNVGGKALRELQDDITDTNAAAEMYAIQNDTLAGSMDFLKSASESLSISMTEGIEPALRGLVDFLTQLIKDFNSMPGFIKITVAALLTLGPAIAAIQAAAVFLAGAFTGIVGAIMVVGTALAATGLLSSMAATARETMYVNTALEQAVKHGEDINVAMRKLSETTGMSLDKVKAIAIQNENINETLIAQDALNNEILTTYQNRAAAIGAELKLNEELLFSQGVIGTLYRRDLDTYLDLLETRRADLDLANEQAALQEQRDREDEAHRNEVAALEEEFRRAQLSEMELAFDDLEIKHRQHIEAKIDDEEWYQKEITKIIEEYADKDTDNTEANKYEDLQDVIDDYEDRLERLGKTKTEQMELDKQAAIDALTASEAFKNASIEDQRAALLAVEEFHDALIDNKANEIFKANFKATVETILSGMGGLLGALSQLSAVLTENRIADLDDWLQRQLEAAGLVEETETERLERQLQEAIDIGDLETAEELRQDLERAQIEAEYQKKLAQIKYEGELQQWRYTLAIGIASAASAILSGYASKPFLPVGLLAGILATAKSGIQIGAIKAQKPQPPNAATGGLVLPTQGGQLVNTAENNSAELLLNNGSEGEEFLDDFAKRVGGYGGGGGTLTVILNMDGKRVAQNTAQYYNNGIVKVKL